MSTVIRDFDLTMKALTFTQVPDLVRRVYHHVTGKATTNSDLAESHREHNNARHSFSNLFPKYEDDGSKKSVMTFTASNSSTYSVESAAPAPIVNRYPNHLLQYSSTLGSEPSILMQDYRDTGHFKGRKNREAADVAMPPPAISRK